MQTSDLMIGNYVYRTNKHTKKKTVHYLTASCILDISSNGKDSSFIYEPIQLTDQWLIDFDFSWYAQIKPVGYWKNGFCIEKIDAMLIHYKTGIGLKYVHKLQNLYKAINEEVLLISE